MTPGIGRLCQVHGSFMNENDLVYRLRKRAEIRRQIPTRKSVQENAPDRIANLLEEAASNIEMLRNQILAMVLHESNSDAKKISEEITQYLSLGGLVNPELADHDAVRDLLMDARRVLDERSN